MTGPLRNHPHTLRSGLVIFPEHYKLIDQLLGDILQKMPARLIVLTDVSGQLVASRGDAGKTNLIALGSLIAGDLAASQEIARLTGEYQDYQMVLREGRTSHILITEAGHYLALLVQTSNETPLGWSRMLLQKTARYLADAIQTPPNLEQTGLTFDIDSSLPDQLPELFSEALDDLWTE